MKLSTLYRSLSVGLVLALIVPLTSTSGAVVASRASHVKERLSALAPTQFVDPQPACTIVEECSDLFASSVAVDDSGTVAVVGSPKAYPTYPPTPGESEAGTAWVFVLSGGVWTEVAQLSPASTSPELANAQLSGFGTNVAISGDGSTITVSSSLGGQVPWDQYINVCPVPVVYVFTRPANGWSGTLQSVSILATPTPERSIPLSSGGALWGCPIVSTGGGSPGTTASMFYLQRTWMQLTDNGDTIVSSAGGSWLYEEPAGGWGADPLTEPIVDFPPPTGTLADGRTAYIAPGDNPIAISADGSTVAASDWENPHYSSNGTNLGPFGGDVVAVFDRPDRGWDADTDPTPLAVITNPETQDDPLFAGWTDDEGTVHPETYGSDFGGEDLQLNATGTVLVTSDPERCRYQPTTPPCDAPMGLAPVDELGYPNNQVGGAYVFDLSDGAWGLGATLVSDDSMYFDYQGESLAISASGTSVLVGAPFRKLPGTLGYGSGAAFLYTEQSGGTWIETDSLDPVTPNDNGDLGWTVALPAAGNAAVIGDPYFGNRENTYEGLDRKAHFTTKMFTRSSSAHYGNVYGVSQKAEPSLTSSPTGAIAPGKTFTVQGRNLTSAKFFFDSTAITPKAVTATTATFVLPPTAYSGSLVARFGTSAIGSGQTVIVTSPVITGFSPTSVKPGQDVTIAGTNLQPITHVQFEPGRSAKIIHETENAITVLVPSGAKTGVIVLQSPIDDLQTAVIKIK